MSENGFEITTGSKSEAHDALKVGFWHNGCDKLGYFLQRLIWPFKKTKYQILSSNVQNIVLCFDQSVNKSTYCFSFI